MKRALLLSALLGCAAPAVSMPRDLLDAQRELARAQTGPFADAVVEDLRDAERELAMAERTQAAHPGSARAADDAYAALRAAEKARVAGRCAAARQALEHARRGAARLREALIRRRATLAELARKRQEDARLRDALRRAHRALLERVRGPDAEVLERADAYLFRIPAERVFLPGTSILRGNAELRLAALAGALASGPPLQVRLQMPNDFAGFKISASLLGSRRLQRVHDTLRAHGVPAAAFLPAVRHPPPGAQVDVIVMTPPLDVAPDG